MDKHNLELADTTTYPVVLLFPTSDAASSVNKNYHIGLHVLFISNSVLLTLAVFCIVPAFFIAAFLATGFLADTVADAGRFRSERAPVSLTTIPDAFAANQIENGSC